MSGHSPCTCKGTRKERMKNWRVVMRNCNYSYFEKPKGQRHYSNYSLVHCIGKGCYGAWRTKNKYVNGLKDHKEIR